MTEGLPWPWCDTAGALNRWKEARERDHRAMIAGDRAGREAAQVEIEAAEADYHQTRERIAELWLMGLRIALDTQPANVDAYMREVPIIGRLKGALAKVGRTLGFGKRRAA